MIEFGAVVVFGIAMVAIVVALAALVKTLFWVIFLPVRLIFWLAGSVLMLPLLVVKAVFGGLLMLLAVPAVVVAALAAAAVVIAVGAALLVPLLPIALLLALIWYLVRPEPRALVRSEY
jgi:hypothetical protein